MVMCKHASAPYGDDVRGVDETFTIGTRNKRRLFVRATVFGVELGSRDQPRLITPAELFSVPNASSLPSALHASAVIGPSPGLRASTSAPSSMRTSRMSPSAYPAATTACLGWHATTSTCSSVGASSCGVLPIGPSFDWTGHRTTWGEPELASHLPSALQSSDRTRAL